MNKFKKIFFSCIKLIFNMKHNIFISDKILINWLVYFIIKRNCDFHRSLNYIFINIFKRFILQMFFYKFPLVKLSSTLIILTIMAVTFLTSLYILCWNPFQCHIMKTADEKDEDGAWNMEIFPFSIIRK